MRSAGEMDQADAELRATICKVSLVKYSNNFYCKIVKLWPQSLSPITPYDQPKKSPNKFKD